MFSSNKNNIDTTECQVIDLDDIETDTENYSDNELPLSSIANFLLPLDNRTIFKINEDDSKSTNYQSEININNDCKSKICLISNQEQNVVDNLVNQYKCDICGKIFRKRSRIIEHFQRSLCFPENYFNFENNSSKYHNSCNNTEYSILHNGVNSLVTNNIKESNNCKICQSVMQNNKLLKNHQKLHTNKNNFECDIFSNYGFTCKNIHSMKKQWKCQICKKSFKKLSILKEHRHIHYNNKQLNYDKCNESTKHLNSFEKHKIIHTSNCEVYHQPYFGASSFTAQKIIHNLKNNNQCNVCQKHLNSKSNVFKHISKVKNLSKSYECSRCSKMFYKRSEIISHIFESHQEDYAKYSCDTCSTSCKTFQDFILRFEKKKLKCDVCPESKFTSSHRLHQHYKWHIGINHFKCQYCPITFSKYPVYLAHEKTHIEEKPFRCNFCGKWFPVSSNLNIHLRFHNQFMRNIRKEPQISTLLPHDNHPNNNQLISKSGNKIDSFSNKLNKYKCDLCMQIFYNQSQICAHILETHY
ncbi:zinc finger protein 616-like [Sipha flava]|uniref:Zinc finger protein 616-like n=1 Tax=Sipha flava TaxID=143950 RepID=A0A8B8FEK8_9HEMI|nr:zinc finger protein 616-like [Sipha flava]XP_025409011.1 zinc finger protein 616-like [Sipha flava]XP_025409012.1 zinc finger protein 616-like [Sipha flava]XP_025409013.1 zinc finger protein 616-like [Sipha flava]